MKIGHVMPQTAHGPLSYADLISGGRGVTGSEQCLLYLAKEQVRAGHQVVCYLPTIHPGFSDGVELLNFETSWPRLRRLDYCDVAISHLSADPLRELNSKVLRILNVEINDWLLNGLGYDQFVDVYVAVSQAHRDHLWREAGNPGPSVQIEVIPNGVDMTRFSAHGSPQRSSHRCVYLSSPDRGLHWALAMWPEIRFAYPDAELHIFYEVQQWIDKAILLNSEVGIRARYVVRRIEALKRHGVVLRGAVPPAQLAQELLQADIQMYPCFAKGTLVLTSGGYKPIEHVRVGELVFTHRGRWRPVTGVSQRTNAIVYCLRAHGVAPTLVTGEHPYLTPEGWLKAQTLRGKKLCHPVVAKKASRHSEDVWWIVGLYLAEGYRQRSPSYAKNGYSSGRVILCLNDREVDLVINRLMKVGVNPYVEKVRTGTKIYITRKWWYEFLGQFGDGAENKTLPRAALELDEDRSEALLSGWLFGDGSYEKYRGGRGGAWRVNCTSLSLVLGMSLVAYRARRVVAGIRAGKKPRIDVIEGRKVAAKQQWVFDLPERNKLVSVDRNVWKRCRSVDLCERSEVWNLSVSEDESYVANGAVVHNCDPVRFTEGFSVSTMECCAAGVIPMITDADALGEIYGESGACVISRSPGREWTDSYLEVVLKLLGDPGRERLRDQVREFAAQYDWRIVAGRWQEMLDRRWREKRG